MATVALSEGEIPRVNDALQRLHGRRLIEAARYVDGDPLLMLVFAERPDHDRLVPAAANRVH